MTVDEIEWVGPTVVDAVEPSNVLPQFTQKRCDSSFKLPH